MSELTIEQWRLSKFIEYKNNPRENDHALDQMCAAINEMGFKVPIIATSDGQVVDGHLRLKAARKLALDTVPVVLADDLSSTQIKAFRILINQSAQWAQWDLDLLKQEMQLLDELDFDLDLIGFSNQELDDLLAVDEPVEQNDELTLPEPPACPISKPGDLWQLGEHRLLCGDALNRDLVDKLMDGQYADMVFTDPPYNVNYSHHFRPGRRGKKRLIKNDNLGEQFQQFLNLALTNLLAVTRGSCYICMSSSEIDTIKKAFKTAGGKWSTFIIWGKNHFVLGRADYQRQYEPILYGWPEGVERFWCGARDQSDLWFIDKPLKNDLHPTMKPIPLVERAICNSSRPGARVLDLFAGSGTTLLACENTQRQAYLMELEPQYVDVIIKRWQAHTKQRAIRVKDKIAFNELVTSNQQQNQIKTQTIH